MTTTLLLFMPVALFVLIGGFCFVGCTFDSSGLGLDFTQYSDLDIIPNPDCVAYWQLSDSPGQTLALDVVGKAKGDPHHGEYKSKTTHPALFPCPDFQLDPSTPVDSAFAPGDLTIGAPGIVTGDTLPPHDPKNPTSTTCMKTDGGFVTVPVNSVINPPSAFSIEFWALPEWDTMAKPALRTVIDSRNQGGGQFFGFAVWVNEAGNWEAQVGGTGNGNVIQFAAGAASLSVASHVVLTCDGTNAALFINGTQGGTASLPAGVSYAPNTAAPLVIGVGTPYLPERTSPSENNFFPLLPFKGKIQDVAIYKAVLSNSTIMAHSQHGKGLAAE
jgi:hypothetical protein